MGCAYVKKKKTSQTKTKKLANVRRGNYDFTYLFFLVKRLYLFFLRKINYNVKPLQQLEPTKSKLKVWRTKKGRPFSQIWWCREECPRSAKTSTMKLASQEIWENLKSWNWAANQLMYQLMLLIIALRCQLIEHFLLIQSIIRLESPFTCNLRWFLWKAREKFSLRASAHMI